MDEATSAISRLLAPLTNWERTRPDAARFDLAAMRSLLLRPGVPDRAADRLVQVGGSKGKGTTSAYLEALGEAAGLRTGVYSSPHVSSICERVRLRGRPVEGPCFVAAIETIVGWLRASGTSVSAFEVLTAAALDLFHDHEIELGILEVGLGGRLDATTAVDVDVSVITSIELEHTEILGDSIEAIAGEKAWILRPGKIGVTGLQGTALDVARAHAERVGCRLLELGRDLRVRVVAVEPPVRRVRLERPDGAAAEVVLRGAPPHEVHALALAWGAMLALGIEPGVTELDRPTLPARFEVRRDVDGEILLLDGAHTARSAEALAAAIGERFPGQRLRVLFGSAKGKRWQEVLSALLPIADSFVVTEISGTASEDPATIRAWLAGRGARARAVPDAVSGLDALRQEAGLRLVTGSFYLAGAVRELSDPHAPHSG